MALLLDYTFVGGMPEVVAAWFAEEDRALARAQNVRAIHRDLADWQFSFMKCSGMWMVWYDPTGKWMEVDVGGGCVASQREFCRDSAEAPLRWRVPMILTAWA